MAIKQGNDTIKKITEERDALSKKLNETVAKYNKLQAEGAKPANTAAAQ
ncbi:hypothetical protein [Verrucomicrobium spinosum]|nr:hypothetical protein [Verrucomicrobium spinosum]